MVKEVTESSVYYEIWSNGFLESAWPHTPTSAFGSAFHHSLSHTGHRIQVISLNYIVNITNDVQFL